MWNFPHCLGTIDGKHIAMECPLGHIITIIIIKDSLLLCFLESVMPITPSLTLTLEIMAAVMTALSYTIVS